MEIPSKTFQRRECAEGTEYGIPFAAVIVALNKWENSQDRRFLKQDMKSFPDERNGPKRRFCR
jgi:hypothetical protein